jgi:hypothetical protein
LIKKLVRAGKHAELWSQKTNQNQKQKTNCIKDDKNSKGQKQQVLMNGLEVFKNQQKFPAFSSEEDDDFFDDEEEDEEEEQMRFISEKANQLSLLRQQAIDANNAKKGVGAIAAASNNGKMNNIGNVNAGNGKKGNPNQNMVMKTSPGGIDPKTMAALKMNGAHLGGGNMNAGEGKRANDISAMMGLAGFHGNGVNNVASAAALGGNSNSLGGGFQVQSNNAHHHNQGSPAGFPTGGYATGQYPSSMLMNMNGYNHPSPMMMNMNMQARHAMQQQQQQPQMMYHRSPFVPPTTGYYYNYSPSPSPSYSCTEPNYGGHNSAAHMFSDENTSSSCSIM